MKKTFLSHILFMTIIVALLGSFNAYAQENSTGKIPDLKHNKFLTQKTFNNQFDGTDAVVGFAYGAQTGLMHDIQLPSGVLGSLPPWSTVTAYASGMTRTAVTLTDYWIIDVGDSVWQFNESTGLVTFWGTLTVAVGANGWAFNPADGLVYLTDGSNLWSMPPPPPTPGPMTPTLIGPHGASTLMIDLCFDNVNLGNCYGYDVATDMAYTINTVTGAATAIGSIGYNANFGQGMGYDYERGWIYLTAFDFTAFDGQLRVLDPETGWTTMLASFGLNQMDPFSPQTDPFLPLLGPGRATAPTPINGDPSVLISTAAATWTNPVGTTVNTVYFGTSVATASIIYTGPATTTVPLPPLTYSTTYYWWVDCDDGIGITPGTLWSFTTEPVPCPVFFPPVVEDFESGVFPPLCWSQTGAIWKSGSASGYGSGTYSAEADFYNVSSGFDDLVSFDFDVSGATTPQLTFDWAYSTYIDDPDQLDIYYSTDGGTTWILLQSMPGGLNGPLNPYHLANFGQYVPASNEWSTISYPLPSNANKISFTATSAFGNNLFVDNIQVTGELFFDDFENPPYVYPGQVACQDTNWTTWSLAPCGNEDATISQNYAWSGTQSALIDYVPPRDVDLVYLTPGGTKTSGKWYTSFAVYIPSTKSGYFNGQATFTVDWGFECYFNAGGAGVLDNGSTVNFTWLEDNWNQCLVVVDLNTSTAEFWFGPGVMTQIATWDWTRGGTIPNTLDGFDFFGATLNDEMYIDDFRFSDAAPPIIQLANDVGTETIDMDYVYGPGTITPQATVKNYGTDTQTFDVTISIDGYSDLQTVTGLTGGSEQQVSFAPWTAATGPYSVTVATTLAGDQDPGNDSQTQSLYVWDESGAWSTGSDFPVAGGYYLGTAQGYVSGANSYLYTFGGNTGTVADCYEYNVNTDTWTAKMPMQTGRVVFTSALVGDFIYAIGGADALTGNYTTSVEKYDITGDSWSYVAPTPVALGWGKAVGYADSLIYLVGGVSYPGGNDTSSVYVYNVNTDTWSPATSAPTTLFGGALSVVGDQLIYVGGIQGGSLGDGVYIGTLTPGSPTTISWITAESTYPGVNKTAYQRWANEYTETEITELKPLEKGQLAEFTPFGGVYKFDAAPWGTDAIIVAGGNDGTPSFWDPKVPNPCFVYYPATDTWVGREKVPEPVLGSYLGSVNDGSDWKLIVASGIDTLTQITPAPGQQTQIFTETLGGSTYTLNVTVADGWNMVSVPGLHPVNQDPITWWPNKDPGASVFKYSGGYVAITATAPTEGYWMKHSGAQTYNIPGIQIVTHNDISAAAGWNMIGGYETIVPVGALFTTPPGLITGTIFEYSGGYVPATNITPGYAYWVNMSAAGLIGGLSAPPVGKVSNTAAEYLPEDWGKIIITDNAGISYTLYAVKGEVNLDNYELPPVPPADMFDIRFGSGRIAEDINSSVQSILMSGIEYPVTVRVENMNITLQDETGTKINAELKPGEELAIENTSINKLRVLSGELLGPIEYALEQNYPNPFNPATTIKFSVPEATNVTLTIFNTLGQKVAELVNGKLEAGRYSYQWDARNIATGMYIYELRTDNFVSVKKMILLK